MSAVIGQYVFFFLQSVFSTKLFYIVNFCNTVYLIEQKIYYHYYDHCKHTKPYQRINYDFFKVVKHVIRFSVYILRNFKIGLVFFFLFFSICVFFHEYSRFTGQQGKGEAISLSLLYHFYPFHRDLDIIGLHKKRSFPLRIFLVNVTKSAGNCGFGHINWRNP